MVDNKNYSSIMTAFYGMPWAILPEKLREIEAFLSAKIAGEVIDVEAAIGRKRNQVAPKTDRRIGVIPIMGTIVQRAGMLNDTSGVVSAEDIGRDFDSMLADPEITKIVLQIDSPGGSVYGVGELADKIFGARGQKRIVAVADPLMASAAYWIGSAADLVVATPSALVGSIGVVSVHQDISQMEQAMGVTTTLLSAGRKKVLGNPYEPLSIEARAELQEKVNTYYSQFVAAVSRNRGVSAAEVRGGYGEGGVEIGGKAVSSGLADRVMTFEQVVEKLASGVSLGRIAAEDAGPTVEAEQIGAPSEVDWREAAERRKALLARFSA